jgi:hypothetical protein
MGVHSRASSRLTVSSASAHRRDAIPVVVMTAAARWLVALMAIAPRFSSSRRRRTARLAATLRLTASLAFARGHAAILVLVAAGAALRLIALLAIYPGIWFSDTPNYVRAAATGILSDMRVSGYSLLVAPFYDLGSAGALIITQHLIGLGIVVALYALLVRRGISRPVAALAVIPAALDAYLIDIEHMIMSETTFHAALVAAIVVLLWRDRVTVAVALSSGLLLGYAGVVRSVGAPAVVVFVLYLLARRAPWRTLVAFVAGWVIVAGAYATIFDAQHGHFGFTVTGGRFLYGQVAPLTDCSLLRGLPASERFLCPDPAHPMETTGYLWGLGSPIRGLPHSDPRLGDFARRVIRAEPGRYVHLVVGNFLHDFEPGHRIGKGDYSDTPWQFPEHPHVVRYPGYRGPIRRGSAHRKKGIFPPETANPMVHGRPVIRPGLSRFLHGYQRLFYTSGQVLAACVLAVLAALAMRRGTWRLRLDAALIAACVLVALLVAAALSQFDYRYGLSAALLLPVAGAMAGTGLVRGRPA